MKQVAKSNDNWIEVEATDVDCGPVEQNREVKRSFQLRNRSAEPIVIRDVVKSCGCTTTDLTSKTIAPGEFATLEITWNTSGLRGRKSQSVAVIHGLGEETVWRTLSLSVSADVQSPVKSSLERLDFVLGEPSTQIITFHRADGQPIRITSCSSNQEAIQVKHEGAELSVTFDPRLYRPESGDPAMLIWTDCPEESFIRLPGQIRK